MDQSLYSYSLYVAIPLMLFFGCHMLLARVPEKRIYSNFLLSRRLMGTALLVLVANYSVHLFFAIRTTDVRATILMNMSTYFLCYWLFSAAMMTLLDRTYVTRRRFVCHVLMWIAFSALSCVAALLLSDRSVQVWMIVLLAAWLVAYGLFLSVRLLRTYASAIRMFQNTHSDDIGAYIRWLSVFTYWAVCFGVGCALLTFLPDEYVFLWILSSVPFYIYLYCCYQNYLLFYEKVETAFMEDLGMEEGDVGATYSEGENQPAFNPDMVQRIEEWKNKEGYLRPGVTLYDLSAQLGTNRTYLSQYINNVYQKTFRDWISDLRIEYAKRLMEEHPEWRIQEISDTIGFLSVSHFSRTFSEKEGCSPARWRKDKLQ